MTDLNTRVRVIIVTDGDLTAQEAVETAANDLNLFVLKATGGNPTRLTGSQVLNQILQAPYDPVIVMVDDKGQQGTGPGEKVIEYLLNYPYQVKILGIVAVASDSRVRGVEVDFSIDAEGKVVKGPVKKDGTREKPKNRRLEGDTVEILKKYPELLVVGCGDLGKMQASDIAAYGAFVTSRCFQEILERSRTTFV
ncbi:MAG: stage V sporulation protein AE [Syntrophomonadaceae bacterium]|nr:stage V sporulation protein AE [Syntrophomonadaceae bacterium]MDD3890080.1 stage V sporulation protein AE [Syntrophomonadaceae bacterium]MDD4548707.1 stage V sporulation protein AE [Syntrophomonadaceae bacterium]